MAQLRIRLNGEAGFSLAELLVVIALLGMVLGGVMLIFQTTQQTYARASSQEEAQMSARVGVDQMARELRYVGAFYNNVPGAGPAITTATPTSITVLGDVNGDSVAALVETQTALAVVEGATALPLTGTAQQVSSAFSTYANPNLNEWVFVSNGAEREVRRLAGIAGTTVNLNAALDNAYPQNSIVRSIETVTYAFDAANSTLTRAEGGWPAEVIAGDVTNLTFAYFNAVGAPTAVVADIREIQINLTTRGDDGTPRTMMTRVTLWDIQ